MGRLYYKSTGVAVGRCDIRFDVAKVGCLTKDYVFEPLVVKLYSYQLGDFSLGVC